MLGRYIFHKRGLNCEGFQRLKNSLPKFFSLYDVTADEYLTDGEYNMHGPIYFSDNFSLTGLTAGHKYIIRFAGSGALARDVSTY